MTAMSATSASETPSTANSLRDLVASLCTVVVPASPATYANRAALREFGLRWDSVGHRWHGTTTMERVRELRERLGLEVKCFGTLEPPRGPRPPRPPGPALVSSVAPYTPRDRHPVDGCMMAPGRLPRRRSCIATRTRTRKRSRPRRGGPAASRPRADSRPTRGRRVSGPRSGDGASCAPGEGGAVLWNRRDH
jgi:hypothetical protein